MNRLLLLSFACVLNVIMAFNRLNSERNYNNLAQIKMCHTKIPRSYTAIARYDILKSLKPLSSIIGLGIVTAIAPNYVKAAQSYLKEPTPEFKEELAKNTEFVAKRMKIKEDWDNIFEKFSATENPQELEKYLRQLGKILSDLNDMPIGAKRTEIVKTCRSKKFNGGKKKKEYWTTDVEIAYQELILMVNKLLIPVNSVSFLSFCKSYLIDFNVLHLGCKVKFVKFKFSSSYYTFYVYSKKLSTRIIKEFCTYHKCNINSIFYMFKVLLKSFWSPTKIYR